MPKTRKLHRVLGLALLPPLLCWAVTGFLFHLKPGWNEAYDMPSLRLLELGEVRPVRPAAGWLEVRRLRTVLGEHLLVRTADGWEQVDPLTLVPLPMPADGRVLELLNDALRDRPRYGEVVSLEGSTATTTTGVQVTLNWTRMSLSQSGKDTERINRLYSWHYLQWTGVGWLDKILAAAGLFGLLLLALLGLRLATKRTEES